MAETYVNTENATFEKVWFMFQETDKKFQETDKKFQETDKKLNKLEKLFTSQWGKLIESLVEGDLVKILRERGIKVNNTATRIKVYYSNRQYEFAIIAENGAEIVVVEVKTTLRPDDVKEFLDELNDFKNVLPRYQQNRVLGAVAYLTDDSEAALMSQKKGLFAIRATGNSSSIINNNDFEPKVW